jgi:hypothetical protein
VKWSRAVHHVEELARTCAAMTGSPVFRLPVVQLWAVGDVLGTPRDLDRVTVAIAVDLPVDDVPWLSEPVGAEHWAHATRVAKNPIRALWRSSRVPIWNHGIVRPALVWDATNGVAEETLRALRDGRGEEVRTPAPNPDDLRKRLDDELAVCLHELRRQTRRYDDRRWSPGKLTPVSDALWRASEGYLDVLDAVSSM